MSGQRSALAETLSQLRLEGRVESSGTFVVDEAREGERYAGILEQSHSYLIVRMAQLAHSCRSSRIDLRIGADWHGLSLFPRQHASQLRQFLAQWPDVPRVPILEPLRQLFLAGVAARPRDFSLCLADEDFQQWLHYRQSGELLRIEVPTSSLGEGSRRQQGLRLSVEIDLFPGFSWKHLLGQPRRNLGLWESVERRLDFAPLLVSLDGLERARRPGCKWAGGTLPPRFFVLVRPVSSRDGSVVQSFALAPPSVWDPARLVFPEGVVQVSPHGQNSACRWMGLDHPQWGQLPWREGREDQRLDGAHRLALCRWTEARVSQALTWRGRWLEDQAEYLVDECRPGFEALDGMHVASPGDLPLRCDRFAIGIPGDESVCRIHPILGGVLLEPLEAPALPRGLQVIMGIPWQQRTDASGQKVVENSDWEERLSELGEWLSRWLRR